MLCRPAFFLIFLVSSTYAASTYNLPLLQETLEIIGGDLITTVTNMINGGEDKDYGEDEVEDKPLFNKENHQSEAEDDDQQENSLTESEVNESSKKNDADIDHVETITEAPSTDEEADDGKDTDDSKDTNDSNVKDVNKDTKGSKVTDDSNDTDDDKDNDDNQEENDSGEGDDNGKTVQTDKEYEASGKTQSTNQVQGTVGQTEEGSDGNGLAGDENAVGEEEEDDEAKILASTFVNLAAEKIKSKLKDFELIN